VGIKGNGLEVRELTFDETRELGPSLDPTKGGSSPCSSSN